MNTNDIDGSQRRLYRIPLFKYIFDTQVGTKKPKNGYKVPYSGTFIKKAFTDKPRDFFQSNGYWLPLMPSVGKPSIVYKVLSIRPPSGTLGQPFYIILGAPDGSEINFNFEQDIDRIDTSNEAIASLPQVPNQSIEIDDSGEELEEPSARRSDETELSDTDEDTKNEKQKEEEFSDEDVELYEAEAEARRRQEEEKARKEQMEKEESERRIREKKEKPEIRKDPLPSGPNITNKNGSEKKKQQEHIDNYIDALVRLTQIYTNDLKPEAKIRFSDPALKYFINAFNYTHCLEISPAGQEHKLLPIYMTWGGSPTRLRSVRIERGVDIECVFESLSGKVSILSMSKVATELADNIDEQTDTIAFMNTSGPHDRPYYIDYRDVLPLCNYIVAKPMVEGYFGRLTSQPASIYDTNGFYKAISEDVGIKEYWKIDERYVPESRFSTDSFPEEVYGSVWISDEYDRNLLKDCFFPEDNRNLNDVLMAVGQGNYSLWTDKFREDLVKISDLKEVVKRLSPTIRNIIGQADASCVDEGFVDGEIFKEITSKASELERNIASLNKDIQKQKDVNLLAVLRMEAAETALAKVNTQYNNAIKFYAVVLKVTRQLIIDHDDDTLSEAFFNNLEAEEKREADEANLLTMSLFEGFDVLCSKKGYNKMIRSNVRKGQYRIDIKFDSPGAMGVLDMSFHNVNKFNDTECNKSIYGASFNSEMKQTYRKTLPDTTLNRVIHPQGMMNIIVKNQYGTVIKSRDISYNIDMSIATNDHPYLLQYDDVKLYLKPVPGQSLMALKLVVIDV